MDSQIYIYMVITIYLITGHVDEQLLLQWKIYIFFWEDGGGGGGLTP